MLRDGAVIAYPTDSSYALGCHLGDADALRRLRQLRGVDDKHHLTLVCADLSELGKYARVDNRAFRLLKLATPGPYTFILEGTREVPKRLLHPKRATLGLRVPDHPDRRRQRVDFPIVNRIANATKGHNVHVTSVEKVTTWVALYSAAKATRVSVES